MKTAVHVQSFLNKDLSKYDTALVSSLYFGFNDGRPFVNLSGQSLDSPGVVDFLDNLAREKGYRHSFSVGLSVGAEGGWDNYVRDPLYYQGRILDFLNHTRSLFDFVDIDLHLASETDVRCSDIISFCEAMPTIITASPRFTLDVERSQWDTIRAHVSIREWHLQTDECEYWTEEFLTNLSLAGYPLSRCMFGFTSETFDSVMEFDEKMCLISNVGMRGIIELT